MINIEQRHLEIVKKILNNYNYSFFLFGSRITQKAKKFSDIDLFYLEAIPSKIFSALEEEFEESDLPYKVDLLDYHKCDPNFQKIMLEKYICIKLSSQLSIIEENCQRHFAFLPTKLGFAMQKIDSVSMIHCGLGTSMFNIAYGVPAASLDFEDALVAVKEAFQGQSFAWWIPPSQHNFEFTAALVKGGFIREALEHAMICDLANTPLQAQKTELAIKPVLDGTVLTDFIHVLEPYDASARSFYGMVKNAYLEENEKLFVGYIGKNPVVISILFVAQQAAGIFSLLTNQDSQCKGYGTDMMRYLLQTAQKNGCKYVTLSSSSDAGTHIYQALGFRKIGEFECFEYKVMDHHK